PHASIQVRNFRSSGDGLAQLRFHLHRTLHGLAKGQPQGIPGFVDARGGSELKGQSAAYSRHERRQRASAKQHPDDQRTGKREPAIPIDAISRENTWGNREGARPPVHDDARLLRAEFEVIVARPPSLTPRSIFFAATEQGETSAREFR